jgi:hypothetical protein
VVGNVKEIVAAVSFHFWMTFHSFMSGVTWANCERSGAVQLSSFAYAAKGDALFATGTWIAATLRGEITAKAFQLQAGPLFWAA